MFGQQSAAALTNVEYIGCHCEWMRAAHMPTSVFPFNLFLFIISTDQY